MSRKARDLNEKRAGDLLREHDAGTTARERGYSHGQLPGPPPGVEVLHLTSEHWQNVGGFRQAEDLSDQERDEERRGAGAYSDELPDGDIVVTIRFRRIDPRSWRSGWDAEAMAEYLTRPERSSGMWNDQVFKNFMRRKARKLPPRVTCPVDGVVFQPERRSAVYCSSKCSSKAARERRKRQANGAVA